MTPSSNSVFQNSEGNPSQSIMNSRPNTPPMRSSPSTSSHLHNKTSYSTINNNDSNYNDQVSLLSNNQSNVDIDTVNKHLVNSEDSLKTQGGDITRRLYHQMNNVIDDQNPKQRRLTRSSSFSTYLEEARKGSFASDINVPGGFRREFIINQSIKKNQQPPNFLTRNFMEFLSIYGHFAGEDFNDDEDEQEEVEEQGRPSESYEDVFDEESSLLVPPQVPKRREQPKGTASIAKTFFLLFKSLVGSGVLFLPRAFYNGGMFFSIVTLSLFGILTLFCYIVLIKSKKILKLTSFGELGFKTYGTPLKICILVSIIISQIGFVATYILFTAENMIAFIQQMFQRKDISWLTRGNMVLIQCVLLIPLVLIRNLTKLSFVSLVSSIFIVIGLLIIFYFSSLNIINNGIGPNITNFNSNSWTMLIGVAVTSFEGIGLILPIESSMANPNKFPMVLSVSMLFITLIFVSIGTIGYLSFGDKIKSIIILNLPQNNIAVRSITILYSIAVFLSAPLQLFPAIKIGESLVFNKSKGNDGKLYHQSGKYNPQVKWLKNGFRAMVVIAISLLAFLNADNIDKFVSFNGCFACIPLVYIYPPLIHLRTSEKQEANKGDKYLRLMDYLLIVVGVLVVIYSSYQIVFLN